MKRITSATEKGTAPALNPKSNVRCTVSIIHTILGRLVSEGSTKGPLALAPSSRNLKRAANLKKSIRERG